MTTASQVVEAAAGVKRPPDICGPAWRRGVLKRASRALGVGGCRPGMDTGARQSVEMAVKHCPFATTS